MNRSVQLLLFLAPAFAAMQFPSAALPQKTAAPEIQVVESTEGQSPGLVQKPPLHFDDSQLPTLTIRVDASTQFQTIDGFGASFTDSSAWLFDRKLSPQQ